MSEEVEAATEEEVSQEAEQESQVNDIEERARTMGWVPKEEFRGDETRWVDAEQFVKRGEDELPIMKERYRKLESKFSEMEKTLKQFAKHHENVSEREYKKALEDIRKQKAEAVSLGDSDAYLKAEEQEDKLRSAKPEKVEIADDTQAAHPDWDGWLADNQWYSKDKAARMLAESFGAEMVQTHSHLHGRAFFDAVKARVKEELPHKFENPRRNAPPAVEGAGSGKPKSKGKSYSDLPAEAKAACDRFVKQNLMTKEQYLKEYDWS